MNSGPKVKYNGPVTKKILRQWKKLTPKEKEKQAIEWDRELKESHREIRLAQFKRGENAVKLAVSGGYKLIMGDDASTLNAYLAQPEFKINIRQFYRLMRVWQTWVNEFGYTYEQLYEIPLDVLEQVAQIVSAETKDKWFHALKTLSMNRFYKGNSCIRCNKAVTIKNKSGYCRSCRMLGNKNTLGWKMPFEQRNQLSIMRRGRNNKMWKGDKVGLNALHAWLKNRIQKPSLCEICKVVPPYDLANKGKYNRNFKNWYWLCRKCHMESDGRMEALKKYAHQNR